LLQVETAVSRKCLSYAALRPLLAYSLKSLSISRLHAGISLGCRLLTQFRSRTTSLPTQFPPNVILDGVKAGQRAALDAIRSHGPGQITANGFPVWSMRPTNSWACFSTRS